MHLIVIFCSGTVTYVLSYPVDDQLPTDAKVIFDFGEHASDQSDIRGPFLLNGIFADGNRTYSASYTYSAPGDYYANVTIFNEASAETFQVSVSKND